MGCASLHQTRMWPLVPRLRPLISSCQVLVFTHYVCVYILYPRCCCSPHLSSLAASTFRMRQSSPLFFLLLLLLLLAFHTAAMASRVLREDEITGPEEIKYESVLDELEFFPRHNVSPFLLILSPLYSVGDRELMNSLIVSSAGRHGGMQGWERRMPRQESHVRSSFGLHLHSASP